MRLSALRRAAELRTRLTEHAFDFRIQHPW